jgi:electron transport complex protein RnfB
VAGPAEAGPPTLGAAGELLEDAIDALLPQTQCRKCGFDGCRPYARALAAATTPVNRCPPGGRTGIARLARLLQRPELPLDPACGTEAPRRLAWIDPTLCIGCTKCIQACPVDAIIGAQRRMHTVAPSLCTGCDLCVAPCPVDCITMRELPVNAREWTDADASAARLRHEARALRLARGQMRRQARLAARAVGQQDDQATRDRRAIIETAMRRARERLGTARASASSSSE